MGGDMSEREVVGEVGPHMRAAGKRIKAWRIKAGMSQQVLAEVFGCSLSDVFAEATPKPTKYATLITAWNALPSDKHRETLLALIQQWAAANQAASRSR
jgi:transcriptional regulator with XRE-family HTH domain